MFFSCADSEEPFHQKTFQKTLIHGQTTFSQQQTYRKDMEWEVVLLKTILSDKIFRRVPRKIPNLLPNELFLHFQEHGFPPTWF